MEFPQAGCIDKGAAEYATGDVTSALKPGRTDRWAAQTVRTVQDLEKISRDNFFSLHVPFGAP